MLVTPSACAWQFDLLKTLKSLKGEFFMAHASEIAKVLTAAWISTGVPSKSATEAVEFYRSIY